MYRYRHRTLTLLAALLLPAIAAAQGSAMLEWTPPTRNTDGTPLTNLAGYAVRWGAAPDAYPNAQILSGPHSSYRVEGLPLGQPYYFAVAAINTANVEGERATACAVIGGGVCSVTPLQPPGPVRNLAVTPIATPLPAISVTVRYCGTPIDWCQLVATGAGTVTLTTSNGVIDWNDFPVTPNLGVNNDGVSSRSITFTAPSPTSGNGWWFETDGVTGFASITVNGVVIPFTSANGVWTARTP